MIVYCSSDMLDRQLKIPLSLKHDDIEQLKEGLGVYFSLKKSDVMHSGKFVYTVELNDRAIIDFRKRSVIENYLMKMITDVAVKYKVDLLRYFTLPEMVDNIDSGCISIDNLANSIVYIITHNEQLVKSMTAQTLSEMCNYIKFFKTHNAHAYFFKDKNKNIGVIKNTRPEIAKIVKVERIAQPVKKSS